MAGMYSRRCEEFGDSPQASQYSDQASQEVRMHRLLEVGDVKNARILDFGCGTGHLLTVLKRDYGFSGEFTGYDISEGMIQIAKTKHPEANFEVRDILNEGINETFDFVFISGTFNILISDNWRWMQDSLRVLYQSSTVAVAFNNLSTYVEYFDEGLFYVKPEHVFAFCKTNLSPAVTLRHDYLTKPGGFPFEFATYVYRME
jgi:SAM-dependent methyltransferase